MFSAKSKKRKYCLLSPVLSDTIIQSLGKRNCQDRNNKLNATLNIVDVGRSFCPADPTAIQSQQNTQKRILIIN